MDYPFFVKPIANIPEGLVTRLADLAVQQDYTGHPHFSKSQPVRAYIGTRDFSCPLGRLVQAELLPLIPMDTKTVDMWEVNKYSRTLGHRLPERCSGKQGGEIP